MGRTRDLWHKRIKRPDGTLAKERTARYGKGKRWLAVWITPDNREDSAAFDRKPDADAHWKQMEADRDRGDYRDPDAGRVTVAGLATAWLATRDVDPSSAVRYEGLWRTHVAPAWGHRAVKTIRPSDVAAWLARMKQNHRGLSTPTGARFVLQGILDLAVADGEIRANPARSEVVSRGRPTVEHAVAWPRHQVDAVIDAHPDHLRSLPQVCAATGMRRGEALGLGADDIEFDTLMIHVRRQVKVLRGKLVFALPKNDMARRVPISEATAQELRFHMRRYPPTPCSLPWETTDGEMVTHPLLWVWHNGKPIRGSNYEEQVWKPALDIAGVIDPPVKNARGRKIYKTDGAKVGMHQLRHFFASVMLAGGMSINEVAVILGHSDPGFTLRVYGHMLPESYDRARAVLDGLLFRPRPVGRNRGGTGAESA